MKNKIYFSIMIIHLCFTNLLAQTYVNKEWERTTGSVGPIERTASVLDYNENLIVVSNTLNISNNTDVLITKYDPEGALMWQTTYNGASNGDDYAVHVKLNANNDIFVASTIYGTSSNDFGILKYDENGTLQWANTWNGAGNGIDVPADLDIDNNGDIYMVGGTEATNNMSDYVVVKFNASGIYEWHTTYDYNNLHDAATSVKYDNNAIIVTGASAASMTEWDFATLKINANNGAILNTERTVAAGVGLDNAQAVTTDANNNIYITGYVEVNGNSNIQTVKLNNNFGFEWVKTFDGGFEDLAKDLGVDNFGNIYIAGETENANGGRDYITIKYDQAGTELWVKLYGAAGGTTIAQAEKLAVTANGEVIVVGSIEKNGDKDFATIKYKSDGQKILSKEYDFGNLNDAAKSVSIKDSNIYVSGVTNSGSNIENAIIKYSIIEKNTTLELNQNGIPLKTKNDLIVCFDTSVIKKHIIDKSDFEVGRLEDFLVPSASAILNSVLDSLCISNSKNSQESYCSVKVYKIFKTLTTQETTSISRLGDTIKVPSFWANLLIEFPNSYNLEDVKIVLNTLKSIIKYAEPNFVAELHSANDTKYSEQLSLHPGTNNNGTFLNGHINIEPAWVKELGKPFVKIGVYDSGIRWTHPDFGNGTTNETKVLGGYDFQYGYSILDDTLSDQDGHGTQVAGIIGALRDNNKGIAGITGGENNGNFDINNSGSTLYSLKIFNDDGGFIYSPLNYIANAIWVGAYDQGYALNIMNNSWGLVPGNEEYTNNNITLLKEIIHYANRSNVTFVASRGNNGQDTQIYPAVLDDDWVLTVGGTGNDGQYIHHGIGGGNGDFNASTGWHIDVAAPGATELVRTTYKTGYSKFNGTSASAPHVSGVAGLLMSYLNNPEPHYQNLAPEDVEQILQMSAKDCFNEDTLKYTGIDSLTGYGLVDAGAALDQVDKSLFYHTHFGTSHTPNNIYTNLFSSFDTVQLSEKYQNENGQWFYPNINYVVNTYKVQASIYHNLPILDTIVSFWTRPSSSNLLPHFNTSNNLLPRERIYIEDFDKGTAYLAGYIYEVKDNSGNTIGWWPRDTSYLNHKLEYTILFHDPFIINNITNVEVSEYITAFPNPSNQNQTLKINFPKATKLIIDLYDISGRIIYQVYNGEMDAKEKLIQVPLSNFSSGVYIYHLKADDITYHYKIIKE